MSSPTVCSTCYLHTICLPRDLRQNEIRQLESLVHDGGSLDAGQHLFQQGQPLKAFFLIRSGMVKTVLYDPYGAEQVLGFHLPGHVLGLDSLEGSIYTSSAIALDRVNFCLLPHQQLEKLFEYLPHLHRRIIIELSHEISENHRLLLTINQKTAEQKLAAFLLQLSAQLQYCSQQNRHLSLPMSRSDIGNFLGLAPETISRALSHLESQHLIEVERRHILIKNFEQLQQFIAHCHGLSELTGKR